MIKGKHSQMTESKITFITNQRALTAPASRQPPPACCEYVYLHFQHARAYSRHCRLYVSFLSRRSKVTSSERGSFLFLRTVIFPCSSSPKTRRKQKIFETGTTFSQNSIHLSCEQRGNSLFYSWKRWQHKAGERRRNGGVRLYARACATDDLLPLRLALQSAA